jgi:small-conductance mechanosensitive channel
VKELDTLDSAINVDLAAFAFDLGESTGRLLLVATATLVAVRLTRRGLRRVDDLRSREQLLFFVPKIAAVMIAVAGLMVVGVDVSGMAAVMATVGFTGAVVFTPVGQNYVAGAMIKIDDLYRPGEVVSVGELHGRVLYRSLLRTELELPDGSIAWVPNSTFQNEDVLNHSRLGGWRFAVRIPIDRASDRPVAVTVMEAVLREISWNCPGGTPFVAFDEVAAEAMFFTAFAWIDDRTQEPYYRGLLLSELVDALEAEGVSVGQTTNLSFTAGAGGPVALDRPPRPPDSSEIAAGTDAPVARKPGRPRLAVSRLYSAAVRTCRSRRRSKPLPELRADA